MRLFIQQFELKQKFRDYKLSLTYLTIRQKDNFLQNAFYKSCVGYFERMYDNLFEVHFTSVQYFCVEQLWIFTFKEAFYNPTQCCTERSKWHYFTISNGVIFNSHIRTMVFVIWLSHFIDWMIFFEETISTNCDWYFWRNKQFYRISSNFDWYFWRNKQLYPSKTRFSRFVSSQESLKVTAGLSSWQLKKKYKKCFVIFLNI